LTNEDGQCEGIWIGLKQGYGLAQMLFNLVLDWVLRKILAGRPVGRPRRRWIDSVCQDAREQLGVKRWRREAEDRKSWRRFIEEPRVRFGL
jgi:hypothetical protein